MAEEARCPMCGQSNSADAETCVHCGARLKPLDLASQESAQSPLKPSGEPSGDDWLASMRMQAEAADSRAEGEGSGPAEELPDWLEDVPAKERGEPPAVSPFSEMEPPEAEELKPAEPAGEIPEWLRRIRSRAGGPQDEQAGDDWISRMRGVSEEQPAEPGHPPAAEPPAAPPEAKVTPDLPAIEPEPEPEPGAKFPPPREREQELPSWMRDVEPPEEGPGEGEAEAPAEGAAPHIPALIIGPEDLTPAEPPPGELAIPHWLAERPSAEELAAGQEGEMDLAPATLPSWLEAMRPEGTFRSVVQIESVDEQSVESAGPLAGLRGVLMAEPVVAMPRSGSVGSMQLAVTERQYAQAELLHHLVQEEQRELPIPERRRPRLALFRWGIAALILLATLLPVVTGSPDFALPSLEPRELATLFGLVEAVPTDRPALMVFDYEPGYAGELSAVGGALIEQLMARGVPIATLTTRAMGSPLATRELERLGTSHGYQMGENMVHLGFLSGGPTAVQLFAINPRDAIVQGFGLPEELRQAGISAWDTAVLAPVQTLADFSIVVVFSAGTETARVWPEQAEPRMGSTPLVMVLSTGAEPMMRPYFEARRPQVNGILTGLPAATAYERRNGQVGLAQARWDAFGSAMLAAEFVLVAGIAYGAVQWWLSRLEQSRA